MEDSRGDRWMATTSLFVSITYPVILPILQFGEKAHWGYRINFLVVILLILLSFFLSWVGGFVFVRIKFPLWFLAVPGMVAVYLAFLVGLPSAPIWWIWLECIGIGVIGWVVGGMVWTVAFSKRG